MDTELEQQEAAILTSIRNHDDAERARKSMSEQEVTPEHKPNLDDPRMYDCCAHVTKGGKHCGALRWYHDDPGRKRHKFVEPKRDPDSHAELKERVHVMRTVLREALWHLTKGEEGATYHRTDELLPMIRAALSKRKEVRQ